MENYELKIHQNNKASIIEFLCDLDVSTVNQLRPQIDLEIGDANKNIIIDLNNVEFIDSHGVGLFVNILKRTYKNNSNLIFIGARNQPKSVLKMVGLNYKVVKYYDDLETALKNN